nr:hypothetical protein B0A51_07183 [Rachicladosporium sp. CCFEE 5018]
MSEPKHIIPRDPKPSAAILVGDTLDKASRDIPPYLFRVWSEISGDRAEEKTLARIVPLAFLDHERRGTDSAAPDLNQVPINYLKNLVDGHLNYDHIKTMFSSWSPSLKFVLNFWACIYGSDEEYANVYVSVIDTATLPAGNRVLYVPRLAPMYPKHRRRYFWNLDHEYLLYGPVEGHLVTGPASAFADADVEMGEADPTALTIAEIVKHRDCLAEIYGEELAVAVVASSLCAAKRNVQDRLVRGPEAKTFTEIMKDFDVSNVD